MREISGVGLHEKLVWSKISFKAFRVAFIEPLIHAAVYRVQEASLTTPGGVSVRYSILYKHCPNAWKISTV